MAKSNTAEFMEALTLLAKEKGIEPEVLIEKIETALTIAIKKDFPKSEEINYDIDIARNKFDVSIMKTVVEEVTDPANEITLEAARDISKRVNIGDKCPLKIDTRHLGRIAVQSAKQVIKQSIKTIEREQLVTQWGGLQNSAVSAEVKKVETDSLNAIVSVNGTEVMLFRSDQIPADDLHEGDVVKIYVSGVSASDKRPTLRVSRTHPELVRKLFELEVPEIADGTVEIKAVSREAGSRSKIAVISNNENVDALGACIGPQKNRISRVCEELCGEKIDVVLYSDDPKEFIKQALKPATVLSVDIPDEEIRACSVIVPVNQLSLAIGNKGQNAKLAAKLTRYKIDIEPEGGRFFENKE
ncbi:MAG: transcription termination/antitermination protein NusA [Ruminiclostridium sp.]|nr:transcription termination/antitermination protein NusA [Ruminiclostridium sp.]